MDFKDIQEGVMKTALSYAKEYNIKVDENFVLLKLYEEVGELAQAVLIKRKKSRPEKYISEEKSTEEVAKELADVFGTVVVVAHVMGIDLEATLNKKWLNR